MFLRPPDSRFSSRPAGAYLCEICLFRSIFQKQKIKEPTNNADNQNQKKFFKKHCRLPSAAPISGGFSMQTIKYTFADGTTSTVEVSDELHAVHLEIVQQEKRNHWRETRRHTSLYYLMENGIDFEDRRSDSPLESYIRKENITSIRKAISMLTPKRQELIYKVFFLGKSFSAIAKETGVSKSAVSSQMQTVYKHLFKFLGVR